MPGCSERAGYRAPRSRQTLNAYFWFCLDHVRDYNAHWDYYKGMTPGQIEAHLRADVSWNRPSWRLGHLGGTATLDEDHLLDPLGLLRGVSDGGGRTRHRGPKPMDERPEALRQPLDALGLGWPVSLAEVKSRYKDLARRHHPDANGGDRNAEERFKTINIAYTALRQHLAEARPPNFAQTG